MVRNIASTSKRSAGDIAVDGLLHGWLAGIAMGIFVALALLRSGTRLAVTAPALGQPSLPVLGLLHLAVSGMYGVVYSFIWWAVGRRLPRRAGGLEGLIYGFLLYALAVYILLPNAGAAVTALTPLQLLLAHLVYGFMLGWRLDG